MSLKVLILDSEGGQGTDFSMRCVAAGHDVKLWINPYKDGTRRSAGDGLVPRVADYHPHLRDADLIIPTGNSFALKERDSLIENGFPIFGAGTLGCKLELDRKFAMDMLERKGVDLGIPYTVHDNLDQAQKHIEKNGGMFVVKPLAGDVAEKSLTFVPSHKDYADQEVMNVFDKWRKHGGIKGKIMLQEFMPGVEVGVSCYFGPGGWSQWKQHNWEHKKLCSHNYGPNTGEMGTVLHNTKKSPLFDRFMEPLTDYLHAVNYCGDFAINAIVRDDGTFGFLENTTRCGWPHHNITQELIKGDPAEWMLDLVNGKDTMEASTDACVGVVVCQPNFPFTKDRNQESEGIPILGLNDKNMKHIHLCEARKARDGQIVTAGEYVCVVSEKAKTVKEAAKKAYEIVDYVGLSSKIVRDDVGEKLEQMLPELHKFGIATDLNYD